jgi:hypothetical protein
MRTTFVTILCATFLSLMPTARAQDEAACSNASVAGRWGYTYTGTILIPTPTGTATIPVAAVGRFTLDADGNFSGTQTRSNGGISAQETLTAKISVNADCTATGNFNVYQSGQLVRTAVLALVFDDDSKEARAIFDSLTLVNGPSLPVVITVQARKINPSGGS